MRSKSRPARRKRSVGVILGVPLLLLVAIAPGSYAAPPEPSALRVTIDNGLTSVATDDTLTYVITVQNLGTSAANDLQVTQSVPATLEYAVADPGGIASAGTVSWTVDLTANESATFRTTMTVLAAPPDLDRVDSVVCVAAAVDVPPTVCATDSDQIAVRAAAEGTAPAQISTPSSGDSPWLSIGAACAVLAVVAVAFVSVLKRRHRGT